MDILSLVLAILMSIIVDIVLLRYLLVKRKYRYLWLLFVPFVLVFLITVTRLPFHLGLYDKDVVVEFVQIREITDVDIQESGSDTSDGAIVFMSDKYIGDGGLLLLFGTTLDSDFDYADVCNNLDNVVIEAYNCHFIEKHGDKYLYCAFFDFNSIAMENIGSEKDIRCKVFFTTGLVPSFFVGTIVGTNEMIIPSKDLLDLYQASDSIVLDIPSIP